MGKTILTGIRVNGELHLGNYLGAMQPMGQLQKSLGEGDRLLMFIPDLHSFNTPVDHTQLISSSISNIKQFIAAGIDPADEKTLVYRQSHVSANSELAVILANFTYFGEAGRMTQFKDKSEQLGHKAVTVGLFTYPILMAADILLYNADYVPVGDDQKQHLELTRTLAERLNNKFGELFKVPLPWQKQLEFANREKSVRIMSLANPQNKMSKSIDDPKGTINLLDDPLQAAKKVMSATTDSVGVINFDQQKQPGITNLLTISALLDQQTIEAAADKWNGKTSYGELKTYVADVVKKFLTDFQEKYNQISDDEVIMHLEAGEQSAKAIAEPKLIEVQKAIGLK